MKILPSEKRFLAILLAAALCGGGLMLLGKAQTKQTGGSSGESVSYSDETEHKIKQIVGAMTGDEPQVFLSYKTKTTEDGSRMVFGSAGSREERSVSAAVILCRGGEFPCVQKELLAMLSTALQIGTNRIYIGPKTN